MGSAPAYPGAPARRAPRLWPWVVTLIAGIALAAAGVGLYIAMAVVPLLNHHGVQTPARLHLYLSPGTYNVYQASIGGNTVGSLQILPADVTVVDTRTGTRVHPYASSSVFTLTSSGISYQGYVEFVVTRAGHYLVHVRSPHGITTLVFVAPSLASALTRGLGYLGLVVAGFLLGVLGFVMLIVRGVQRSRRRTPPSQSLGPRCANGHPVGPSDHFCAMCGAPAFSAQPAAGHP